VPQAVCVCVCVSARRQAPRAERGGAACAVCVWYEEPSRVRAEEGNRSVNMQDSGGRQVLVWRPV
jgi:hypothetical protein